MPVEKAREINDREAAVMFGPVEPVFSIEDREIAAGLPARIYRPAAGEALPVLVYFHGGGWVVGSLDSHDGVARFLANHAGALVIAVDYRMAPEHRFPAAVEDAWASVTWACEQAANVGRDAARVAVGGDSAGGNLAAVVARRARDDGLELVCQLLVYPVLDCATASWEENSAWWLRQYLRTESDALDPDASPLLAPDLAGVAPALILSCALDPLRHQADEYAARLRAAGVRADHTCFEGLVHGAYRMPAVLPGARDMLTASADALRRAFEAAK
ncbi:MAG TPA: alpha/beta hydrolase [Candidatus Dormibacteraeota bacterium]|nr:alpha/beta hydrolase [Candidatus Dormibacteraeota bacterium]